MYKRKLEQDIRCPLERGLAVFGGKWKSRIICVIARRKSLRYHEILEALGNITDAVLSSSLRDLVKDGVLQRIQYEEIPPHVEYRLTERGESVLPILYSIAVWAGAHEREVKGTAPYCGRCDYAEAHGEEEVTQKGDAAAHTGSTEEV